VRSEVEVVRDRGATAVAATHGSIAEGEVDGNVGSGLCCDAGGDGVWTEVGVCAESAEEEGFFGDGPVARWRVEGRSGRWLGARAHR
jgi:hypothetical protein